MEFSCKCIRCRGVYVPDDNICDTCLEFLEEWEKNHWWWSEFPSSLDPDYLFDYTKEDF